MPQTRISERSRRSIRRISGETGQTSEQIVERALELLERNRLLDAINAGFAALRADPHGWTAEGKERELWDATLEDEAAS
ncbi:hypothetical protein BH20GEM2_BH20GEM2_07230 [soil metagenome]